MSFLSVLKTIGTDIVKGAQKAEPYTELAMDFVPAGSVPATILNAVFAAEQLITTPGTGADKKSMATTVINAVHPGLPADVVSKAVDGIVAILNDLATAVSAGGVK